MKRKAILVKPTGGATHRDTAPEGTVAKVRDGTDGTITIHDDARVLALQGDLCSRRRRAMREQQ